MPSAGSSSIFARTYPTILGASYGVFFGRETWIIRFSNHSFHSERYTYVDGHIAQLRPAKGMVHVIFAEVVLGQVGDIGLLDLGNVRRVEESDVHFGGGPGNFEWSQCYFMVIPGMRSRRNRIAGVKPTIPKWAN